MPNIVCPVCKGKCCRDDLGYRVGHMGAEFYTHVCDICHDGEIPSPDPHLFDCLRKFVEGWQEQLHSGRCDAQFRYRGTHNQCTCGADENNAARKGVRTLLGMEGPEKEGTL